jgi:hypothetical protein
MASKTLRKQYHFRPSPGGGFYAWDVARLIDLASDLPVAALPLSEIGELHENWWFQTDDAEPTPAAMLEHFRLMQETDLSFPILLCAEGRLMDGMHRVMKAASEGRECIDTVRFEVTPEPDHANVMPAELDYD